jgi:hypothetical protein
MINYHGHRKYLVSLSTRDFSDKISPKAFAVAPTVLDAINYIRAVSDIEADYLCLLRFVDIYFRDHMVDSDIVGNELGAYSVTVNFKRRDSRYTWMYLTITLVYLSVEDIPQPVGTKPFICVVCDKTNSRLTTPDEKTMILGDGGHWDFYVASARVENVFVSSRSHQLHERSAIESAKFYGVGFFAGKDREASFNDHPKETYIIKEKTEKIACVDSPCRNAQAWHFYLSNKRCEGIQIELNVFCFPVISDIEGIITFQEYQSPMDYY